MFTFAAKHSTGFAGVVAALVMLTASPVLAQGYHGYPGHGGYHHPPPPPPQHWHGHPGYDHGHPNNTGAIVGGALLGLGVGAAIGALAAPPPVVYAPPPAYYPPAPPPVYYGY